MVILCILAGLLFIYLSGHYIATLMNKSERNPYLNLAVGYVFTQLIFLVGIYISNAYYSFYFLISLFFIFTIMNIKSLNQELKEVNFKVLGLLIVLICLLGYVYIYYGLETYWHTASEDCFDAINGKDYILGLVDNYKQISYNGNIWSQESWTNVFNSFLYSDIVFQYSSVSFWSLFFNLHTNLDTFMIQSALNLVLMFFGMTVLLKHIFRFSNLFSYILAFFTVYSNLYYGTYFNTHQGSMMFGAVIPYVLYLFFKLEEVNFKDKKLLFLLLIMSIFLLFTYKHPFIFFIVPAFVYIFREKLLEYSKKILSNKLYLVIISIIVLAGSYYLYNIFEHYLNFRDSRFRSWGISLEPEMLLIYWGLVQSQITNIGTSAGIIYTNLMLKYVLYAISIIYIFTTLYGYFKFAKKYVYFQYFIVFWILFFVAFKFVLADSYYFYKFLYTTQFVILIFFFYGLKLLLKKRILKIVSIVLFSIFVSTNISYNIFGNYQTYTLMQNKNAQMFKTILEAPKEILEQSFLEIPKQHYKQIVQVTLRSKRIFTKINIEDAKYIVLVKSVEDIYFDIYKDKKAIFENKYFKIIEKPALYFSSYGGWESEVFKSDIGGFSNIPFKWMSNIMGPLHIKTNTQDNYLQACFESGPSIGFGKFDIHLDKQKNIAQGVDCKYFELIKDKIQYKIYSDIKGKKLLPFDERSLEYKIANLKITNVKFDKDVLSILNPKDDVANQNFALKNNIVIGNGWYPQELPNMRWGSDNVELLILNSELDRLDIEFDLEPGPSLKELPLKIDILTDNNEKIAYIEIDKREKIRITLPVKANERYQIIKLKVLNDTKKLNFDPRDLNLRLFSVKVVD